jgi:hypothetical protein
MSVVRLVLPARVFFCVHASGGHSVRLLVSSKLFDVTTASAASFFLTFADTSTATWATTLIADPLSGTFAAGVTASSVYVDHVLITGDLVPAQIGDALLETTVTIAGQARACDARILSVTE